MSIYYVTYEVMEGSIGLITVRNVNVQVETGDTWTQINREVGKIDPGATVVGYVLDDEDYVDMLINADSFC